MLSFSAPFRAGADAHRLAWSTVDGKATLSVETAWHSRQLSNDTASSVIVGNSIYGFDLRNPQTRPSRPSGGEFRCLDLESGSVRWSSDQPGHATIAVADGKLWLFNDRGELILIRADPERYDELGRMSIFPDEVSWTSPALAEGKLLLRTHGHMACVEIGGPQASNGAPATSSVRRRIVFRWEWLLNGEREFPLTQPELSELLLWFGAGCRLVLLPITLIVLLVRTLRPATAWPEWCCILTVIAGVAATPLANSVSEEFLFTWPVALSAAQLGTFLASNHFAADPMNRRRKLRARAAGLAFFALLVGYYVVLLRLSLPFEWIFLCGLLPGTAVLWPIARHIERTRSTAWLLIGLWLGYAVLFWSAVGFARMR
jgi:hypothetical protein